MPHPILHLRTRWTHEKFLIDAFARIHGDAARRLRCIVLHRHRAAFAGCRDPDRRFRDFHNHVIHVEDGFWGGAPRLAGQWFQRAVDALARQSHARACYAIGVLTHYVTDPMHPLHTASDAVGDLYHGPAEYLANVRYADFRDRWHNGPRLTAVRLGHSPHWLGQAILQGAALAHRLRDPVIGGLDLARVTTQPAAAWDDDFAAANADTIGVAVTTLARIYERVAEAAEMLRDGPLTAPTTDDGLALSSAIAMFPVAMAKRHAWLRRWRRRVEAAIDEYRRTGRMHHTLPTEVDVVRRVISVNRHERTRLDPSRSVASPTSDRHRDYAEPATAWPPAWKVSGGRPIRIVHGDREKAESSVTPPIRQAAA